MRVALLFSIGILVFSASTSPLFAANYSGGDGLTEATAFQISSADDWQTLMDTPGDWGSHFVLTADINLAGKTITPVGGGSTQFTGTLDGQRHVIENIYINHTDSTPLGLFGTIGESGRVENLSLLDVSMLGPNSNGAAGLAHSNRGTISRCSVQGTVSGRLVGGLVYENWGLIKECYSEGTVNGEAAGGLVRSNMGQISNCYSKANINLSSIAGGLAADNMGPIVVCYAAGFVTGDNYEWVGGLVGGNSMAIPLSCFWDTESTGQSHSAAGIGLTTIAMRSAEPYLRAFWDFKGEIVNGTEDIWVMPVEGGYPILSWQLDTSAAPANDEMADAIVITAGSPVAGSTAGATGLDLTANGYNDNLDVWFVFTPTVSGRYTVTVESTSFDTTLGVFDAAGREIAFNDDYFGGKSVVILKATAAKPYYLRIAGSDSQTGDFMLSVTEGAVQAIQGDLNYDGKVNLIDLSTMAQNWLVGENEN